MNRELKFRVWDKQQKKFHTDADWGISLNGSCIIGFSSHDSWNDDRGYKINLSNQDNLIVQQYTGLKGKNGKEIYEGDIVKYYFDNPDIIWVDLVAWESYGWRLLHFDGTESGSTPLVPIPSMEIIGNIFENKELLNQ
jgi:hypothetical protein